MSTAATNHVREPFRAQMVRRLFSRTVEYNVGSKLENVLGLQVARTLWGNALYRRFRRPDPRELETFVQTLDRDGVLVVPDFLPSAEFADVKREFEATRPIHMAGYGPIRGAGMFWKADFDVLGEDFRRFPSIDRHLRHNETINRLVAAAAGRDLTQLPTLRLITMFRDPNQSTHNDNQQTLHADLHLPTFKAFYYVTDVTEDNGPFMYARGSHRLTISRLRFEYEDSVQRHVVGLDEFPVEVIERHKNRLGATPDSVTGRANTLIIANNMGFHARGPFAPGATRQTIELGYREAYLSRLPRRVVDAVRRSMRPA